MRYQLGLVSNLQAGEGAEDLNWTEVGFVVTGLPAGVAFRIGTKQGGGWAVRRTSAGADGGWEGDYESPLAALDAVQRLVNEEFG